MFYKPQDGHGLPFNPFKAIVAPRPIAWLSTRDAQGRDNLAPYSFFNAVADAPPQVVFGSTGAKPDRDGTKDTVSNIRDTGVFAINIVSHALRDKMNISSGPEDATTDEFVLAGLEKGTCKTIDCPFVVAAPAVLECKLAQIIELKGDANFLVLGDVVGIHIDPAHLNDGKLDVTSYQPLARLGYRDYATVSEVFSLNRPDQN